MSFLNESSLFKNKAGLKIFLNHISIQFVQFIKFSQFEVNNDRFILKNTYKSKIACIRKIKTCTKQGKNFTICIRKRKDLLDNEKLKKKFT